MLVEHSGILMNRLDAQAELVPASTQKAPAAPLAEEPLTAEQPTTKNSWARLSFSFFPLFQSRNSGNRCTSDANVRTG